MDTFENDLSANGSEPHALASGVVRGNAVRLLDPRLAPSAHRVSAGAPFHSIGTRLAPIRGWILTCLATSLIIASLFASGAGAVELGEMDLTVLDAKTKDPIPARLRIFDSRGRAPRIRNVPRLGNDFSFQNMLTFKLKTGRYQFTIDRGPHYQQRAGHLEVNRDGFDQKTVTLPRFVDMRAEGYRSGDLVITRDREHLEILMDVEELDYVALPTWKPGEALSKLKTRSDRTIADAETVRDFSACVLDPQQGRYLAANLTSPPDPLVCPDDAFGFASLVKQSPDAHLAVLDPWAWDMPMLVAHGLVDSIAVYGDQLRLDEDRNRVTAGRTPDKGAFSGEHAAGRYAEHIYFQLLNCGLRIPPTAFSNSGDTDNPPGYNRVYVACGQETSSDAWWRNLERGRVIVSNGPVLRVRANEQLPGTVFRGDQEVNLEITCDLATRQKVEYLEIVKNGRTLESVRLDKWAQAGGHLPLVTFKQSGWLIVRAHAVGEKNFRCAMSAPFYVEVGEQKHVNKASATFFKDWTYERAKQINKSDLPGDLKRQRLKQQKFAFDFWGELEEQASR